MVNILEFQSQHINTALALWARCDYIGLNPQDDQPDKLQRFLQRNPGCSFVAMQDDALAGACLCGHDLRRAAIYHLAVAPEFRRAGLGRSLLNASLQALARRGIVKCQAFVFRDNPYNEHFWVPEGWQRRDDLFMYSKPIPPDFEAK